MEFLNRWFGKNEEINQAQEQRPSLQKELQNKTKKFNEIEEYLMNNLQMTTEGKNTLVLLMHDAQAKKVTVDFLPKVIEYLSQQGYEFDSFYNVIM